VAIKRAEEFVQAQQAAAAASQPAPAASASAAATQAAPDAGPADANTDAATTAPASNAEPTLVPLTPAEAPSMYTYDPLERLNRFTYRFNARFDEHVFLPVANGYRRVPGPIRAGVHNFFRNLSEVTSTINYGLQWRLGNGARSLGRFVINSTIGIGGLFDFATKLKLSNEQTGFSATLSTWGMHPGPYLVIPLLGPSTFRDGFGFLADYGIEYGVNVANLYRGNKTYPLGVVNAVDQRAAIDFRYYGSGSPFEYETIRFLYVHRDLIQDEALRARGRRKPQNPAAPAGK
jgi:phospholipid-binding lipoprotein MlaA